MAIIKSQGVAFSKSIFIQNSGEVSPFRVEISAKKSHSYYFISSSLILTVPFIQFIAQVGSIAVLHEARISINKSCFVGNKAYLPGTVFVDQTSFISSYEENFGENNVIYNNYTCKDIFRDRSGSCMKNSSCEEGLCIEYKAQDCAIGNVTYGNNNMENSTDGRNDTSSKDPDINPFSFRDASLKEVSYTGSGIFMRTILIVVFVVLAGVAMFLRDRIQQRTDVPTYSGDQQEGRLGKAAQSLREAIRVRGMKVKDMLGKRNKANSTNNLADYDASSRD